MPNPVFFHYLATTLSHTISTSWLKLLKHFATICISPLLSHKIEPHNLHQLTNTSPKLQDMKNTYLCRLDGFLCVSESKSCLFCFSLIIKITFEHFTIPPPPPLFLSSSGPMKTLLWESFLRIMILYIIR